MPKTLTPEEREAYRELAKAAAKLRKVQLEVRERQIRKTRRPKGAGEASR